jgi:hypothetical protein
LNEELEDYIGWIDKKASELILKTEIKFFLISRKLYIKCSFIILCTSQSLKSY